MRVRLTVAARCAIVMQSKDDNKRRAASLLQDDIMNAPMHCFGNHHKCQPDYCKVVRSKCNNIVTNSPAESNLNTSSQESTFSSEDNINSSFTTNSSFSSTSTPDCNFTSNSSSTLHSSLALTPDSSHTQLSYDTPFSNPDTEWDAND